MQTLPPGVQTGLDKSLKRQNYFLSCLFYPAGKINVASPEIKDLFRTVKLEARVQLTDVIYKLTLSRPADLSWQGGQFVNLRRADGLVRSYSLANLSGESDVLELHIKRMLNGKMSNWLCTTVSVGDELEMQGPNGDCYYQLKDKQQSMLLVATGTGIVPLSGIMQDALRTGHTGEIYVYHGSRSVSGVYQDEILKKLSSQYPNLTYRACVSGDDIPNGFLSGRVHDIAMQHHPELDGWQVFIAGSPPMVRTMQRKVFLAGARLEDIYIDPFEVQDLRKRPRRK